MDHLTRVGKYEIEEFLGGGMAHVYRAKDSVLGRRVALKLLTEAGLQDSEAKARFLQEARTASSISHENIISVFDFGEDQGRPFIVMEFLEGESLRDAIKRGHLGDLSSRLKIALQAARAIDYIHSRKIIHRDIKPENINLDSTGKIKLMDFGIAKAEGIQLTRAGFTLGTPYYMAPEQVLGQPLTPQADVYAFGILLFEVFTGEKPIGGDSVEKIFNHILYEPIHLEPLRAKGVPTPVIGLIARCTAKQPAQRPQGLGIVCRELQQIIDPSQPVAVAATPKSADPMLPPADTAQVRSVTTRSQTASTGITYQSQTMPQQTGMNPAGPSLEGLPKFVQKLPRGLRTQTGLMLVACLVVVTVMVIVFIGLTLTHVI